MQDSQFQVFLILGFIFFRTFFPGILFPMTLLATHILFQENSPRNPKHRTLFPVTFFSKDLRKFGLFSKVLISWVFFQKLFSRDFLTQIRKCEKLLCVEKNGSLIRSSCYVKFFYLKKKVFEFPFHSICLDFYFINLRAFKTL